MQQQESNVESSLLNRFLALRAKEPQIRARNAARELGVSEAELLASKIGHGVIRLKNDFEAILTQLLPFGSLMALTRNECCVHERHGVYDNASFFSHGKRRHGLFVNPDIDLRLFLDSWTFAFAVEEESRKDVRRSIQFFNHYGLAVHKVYLTHLSDSSHWEGFCDRFRAPVQSESLLVSEPPGPVIPRKADEDIDWKGFRKAWEELKNTHDFFPMLKRFKVERHQALRHIGDDFARQIGTNAVRRALEAARDRECEIMVFVGNPGGIQIHTGPVKKLVETGNWYNVLDPIFNLHIDLTLIDTAWVTRKPTVDGTVTALEFLDREGELVLTFFGKRKPGIPELPLWREIVEEVEQEERRRAA